MSGPCTTATCFEACKLGARDPGGRRPSGSNATGVAVAWRALSQSKQALCQRVATQVCARARTKTPRRASRASPHMQLRFSRPQGLRQQPHAVRGRAPARSVVRCIAQPDSMPAESVAPEKATNNTLDYIANSYASGRLSIGGGAIIWC